MELKANILVVDDNAVNLRHAKELLSPKFKVAIVKSGLQAIAFVKQNPPDLILLDVNMPELNGYETFQKIKELEEVGEIPVIFLTSDIDKESEVEGFRMGAMDYITKPFVPEIMINRIERIVELTMLKKKLEIQISEKTRQLDKVSMQTIATIAFTIDAKDRYSKGHSTRVAYYSRKIAEKLGWNEKQLDDLYHIAILHDIGKVAVPDNVFSKPTRLTDEEYDLIKEHTRIGSQILGNTNLVENIADGANYHHERYDGLGYNLGLAGEAIPMVARIIAVADAYDAMLSDRAYRQKLTVMEARNELVKGRGKQFDPKLADIMLELIDTKELDPRDSDDMAVEYNSSERAEESNALLRQVFHESVQETKQSISRDPLTGFYTRRYFEEEVSVYLLNPDNQGSFLMMDLDNFKKINDTYGHIAGDNLIMLFADAIKENVRKTDYVCRLGGDEFAVFYPGISSKKKICKKAEGIIESLRKIKESIDVHNVTSVSIGVALSGLNGKEYQALYNNADKALYYVKNNGKDDYHFFTDDIIMSENTGIINTDIDMHELLKHIGEKHSDMGAYQVEYAGFEKIYQFVSRYITREQKDAQIILFTLHMVDGQDESVELVEETLRKLEHAIVQSLRRGDVTTRFSSRQQIVILMDTNVSNGEMVAKRIVESYQAMNPDNQLGLGYDIQEVHVKNKDSEKME